MLIPRAAISWSHVEVLVVLAVLEVGPLDELEALACALGVPAEIEVDAEVEVPDPDAVAVELAEVEPTEEKL